MRDKQTHPKMTGVAEGQGSEDRFGKLDFKPVDITLTAVAQSLKHADGEMRSKIRSPQQKNSEARVAALAVEPSRAS